VPKNTEAYLWHYATVGWTIFSAEALGIPLVLLKCDKIGPKEEARELEKVLKRIKVDALVLGGVGLQKTQINAVKEIAEKFKIKVVVPYQNYSSEQLIEEEIKSGLDIRITSVASDGLGPEWLGRKLDKKAFEDLKNLSKKFGFDILGEGGYYDTFVTDAPIFKKKIEFLDAEKIWDEKTSSGYLEVKRAELLNK
jgi:predicted ATP pyrophosphatase (TIGR00289 family)